MAIVKLGSEFKPAFIAAAKEADKKLRAVVEDELKHRAKFDVELGELALEFQKNAYHVALGFARFDEYAENLLHKSARQIYQAMRIVRRLTKGDKPVLSREEAANISRPNAELLIDLGERGVRITEPIKKAAMELSAPKFKETIVEPTLRRRPPAASTSTESHAEQSLVEPEREMGLVRERFGVETIAEYGEVMKIAMWAATAHPEDIDRAIPLREQGFKAILAEFRASLEPEYQEVMKSQVEAEEETARAASNRHVEELRG